MPIINDICKFPVNRDDCGFIQSFRMKLNGKYIRAYRKGLDCFIVGDKEYVCLVGNRFTMLAVCRIYHVDIRRKGIAARRFNTMKNVAFR